MRIRHAGPAVGRARAILIGGWVAISVIVSVWGRRCARIPEVELRESPHRSCVLHSNKSSLGSNQRIRPPRSHVRVVCARSACRTVASATGSWIAIHAGHTGHDGWYSAARCDHPGLRARRISSNNPAPFSTSAIGPRRGRRSRHDFDWIAVWVHDPCGTQRPKKIMRRTDGGNPFLYQHRVGFVHVFCPDHQFGARKSSWPKRKSMHGLSSLLRGKSQDQ